MANCGGHVGTDSRTSLAAARVGAHDVSALAAFYVAALGMHEVNRLVLEGGLEVFLNFGDSPEAARANTAPLLLILQRSDDTGLEPMPHVVFFVPDLATTVRAVIAAGGRLDGEPIRFGDMLLGFAVDPAGNRFELIERGVAG